MKKLLLVTLTILLFSCKVQQSNQSASTHPSTSASSDSIEISENTARVMTHKYRPHAVGFRNQTRTVWLSTSRIKMLYDILQYDTDQGLKTDGLRIYFAKYPGKDSSGQKYPHAYRNTLVFVSTKDSTVHKGKGTLTYHRDYYTGASVNGIKSQSNIKSTNRIVSIPENKGELCPPGDCAGALLLNNN